MFYSLVTPNIQASSSDYLISKSSNNFALFILNFSLKSSLWVEGFVPANNYKSPTLKGAEVIERINNFYPRRDLK